MKTCKQMNKVNGSNLDVICWWGKCAEKCCGQKASNESSVKDNARLCNIIMILHVEKTRVGNFDFEREKKMGDLDEKNSLMVGNYVSKEKKTFAKKEKKGNNMILMSIRPSSLQTIEK